MVIIIFSIIFLLPILKNHGGFNHDEFQNFRTIVKKVDNYDYSQGRNNDLEKELDDTFKNEFSTKKRYFYGLARAIYYCNVGHFRTATYTFEQIKDIAPNESEKMEFEAREVICERKKANV